MDQKTSTPIRRPVSGSGLAPAAAPGSPGAELAVSVRDLKVSFEQESALAGISFTVPRGSIVGLIGPSGSGKTTTIRVLTGAVHPDEGQVVVLGSDPRHFRRHVRERIGYMPQLFVLYPELTARENVDVMGALFGMLWRRRRRRTREVLESVELWDVRDRRASRLSGGMQRRLELACALVHEPDLMFLDEPTAGLDPLLRRSVWKQLRLMRDQGRTLLVTTQILSDAEYCDAVALISEGHLVALASPAELRRQALGGEVIQVETVEPFDARLLARVAGVHDVRSQGLRELHVVAPDAGAATPLIIEAIERAGGQVSASREYRPSFDEVFTVLVERHGRQIATGTTAGAEAA